MNTIKYFLGLWISIENNPPTDGETTMEFKNGKWNCNNCGGKQLGYATICHQCGLKNITLP